MSWPLKSADFFGTKSVRFFRHAVFMNSPPQSSAWETLRAQNHCAYLGFMGMWDWQVFLREDIPRVTSHELLSAITIWLFRPVFCILRKGWHNQPTSFTKLRTRSIFYLYIFYFFCRHRLNVQKRLSRFVLLRICCLYSILLVFVYRSSGHTRRMWGRYFLFFMVACRGLFHARWRN